MPLQIFCISGIHEVIWVAFGQLRSDTKDTDLQERQREQKRKRRLANRRDFWDYACRNRILDDKAKRQQHWTWHKSLESLSKWRQEIHVHWTNAWILRLESFCIDLTGRINSYDSCNKKDILYRWDRKLFLLLFIIIRYISVTQKDQVTEKAYSNTHYFVIILMKFGSEGHHQLWALGYRDLDSPLYT